MLSLKKIDIRTRAQPFINHLNQLLDETIALSIWGKMEGPMFISWEESKKLINLNIRVGSIMPLTRSATGKIFAAFYDKEKTRPFIKKELNNDRQRIEEFEQSLDQIRVDGLAYTSSYISGITAISTPVFDQKGSLVAALTVIGLSSVFDPAPDSKATQELFATCQSLSKELGFEK